MRENTSSNNVDVKKLNVEDNNEASKTVSFALIVSEIDFELNDLTVQDTYLCQLQNKNSAININETKNLIHLRNFYKQREIENLCNERDNSLEKNKELEKTTPFLGKLIKENHAKFKYFTGINK